MFEDLARQVSWTEPYRAYQKPPELAQMLEIIFKRQPKVILEIGTHRGGCAYAMQQAAPNARLICVDNNILDKSFDTYDALENLGVRAEFINGDSQTRETLEKVKALTPKVDFCFIDADHTEAGVRADWGLYTTLVPEGGIVALHDISPDVPEHGVASLWMELKASYKTRELWADPRTWGGIGIVYK